MNYLRFLNSLSKKIFRRVFGFVGRDILIDTGLVSAIIAKAYEETEFEKSRVTQDKLYQSDFDKLVEKSKKN